MKPLNPLRKTDCEVRTVDLCDAQRLVEQHHYAGGGANTATFRHGLFHLGDYAGVAWWIPPTKNAANAAHPANWKAVLALSRLVVVPEIPTNAASYLLGASVRLIKRDPRWEYLVTYADKWQGHTGAIYLAAGWDYLGETKPERVYVNAEGRMMGRKRGPTTLTHQQMLDRGFTCKGTFSKSRFGKALR